MSGVRPTPGESIYAAAKAAVIAFTAATANECGPEIRANVVSPGVVRTRMTEGLFQLPGAIDAGARRDAAPPRGHAPRTWPTSCSSWPRTSRAT